MKDSRLSGISHHIWDTKYRYRDAEVVHDRTIEDSWRRIARALASVELKDRAQWEARFYAALEDFAFLPGGRIQAGAGAARKVTLFNCFVMGQIEDSLDGIFDALKEGALTMQQGGGVGYDFSTLRPRGTSAKSVGAIASGPVSFMQIWDSMCATLLSTGARRGAMMATLRCDHPDIEDFIDAKRDPHALRHFNVSVQVTDDFMEAVAADRDWALVFPLGREAPGNDEIVQRRWSGTAEAVPCRVVRHVRARALWDKLMRATYEYAEPGVLFIDRINRNNNLWYREQISATNPCVTQETWVHTANGPRQVRELIGRKFVAIVHGQPCEATSHGFFSTGKKPVYRLQTKEGYALRLTADHPLRRVTKATRWRVESEWTPLRDIRPGDQVLLHDQRRFLSWQGECGRDEGYLLGLLVGDGTYSEGEAQLRTWPTQQAAGGEINGGVIGVMHEVEEIVRRMPHRRDFSGWRTGGGGAYRFLKLAHLTRLAAKLGIERGNKTITPHIERCSSDFYRGFLRGLFDADGSVQGNQQKGVSIRLASSDRELLMAAQRMLLRMGIASTIYFERRPSGLCKLPDGNGGKRLYSCRADHELVISGDNLSWYAEAIGFSDTHKSTRLCDALIAYKRKLNRECFIAMVESIDEDGIEEVFDVQTPGANAFDANGLYVHNCGEVPLPPYGACDLGSINLVHFVRKPFTPNAALDLDGIAALTAIAVRMMDNVIDLSQFPLQKQAEQARGTRHIGLGFTGLADALIMLGLHYGEEAGRRQAADVMRTICHSAYRASIALTREKGPFPFFDREKHARGAFIATLPQDIREAIARDGIRNSHLTAIAPTGTISLLANNVSSGIEPVYDFSYTRRVLELDGSYTSYRLVDYAYARWRAANGEAELPAAFVTAQQLSSRAHLAMQAALQPYVDNSISKTINVPGDFPFEEFKDIYREAYAQELKGCTTFRPNPVTGAILEAAEEADVAPFCCHVEREAD